MAVRISLLATLSAALLPMGDPILKIKLLSTGQGSDAGGKK